MPKKETQEGVEEASAEVPKEKIKTGTGAKSSVSSYKQGINLEKQKIDAYARQMKTNVKSLQGEFKEHSRMIEKSARDMIAEGNKKMNVKVGKFTGEIKDQVRENKEAVSRIENGVKFFISEVNKKNRDFQAYFKGPFNDSIKAFWG